MIVVLAGELTVTLGKQRFIIPAGDFSVFPSDRPHRYANEGDALLRFVRNVVY